MKPKYKIGQVLKWIPPSLPEAVAILTIISIRNEQYHYQVHGDNKEIFSRYIKDMDSYRHVTIYIQPNKIWKELNEG